MDERDEQWPAEDQEVVRRLRTGKARMSGFELDRIKTAVMARAGRTSAKRTAPRSRLLVAVMTVGLMVAGTAGTIAASNASFSGGTDAAKSQYRPPKCHPDPGSRSGQECKCPDHSVRVSKDRCVCPSGETFAEGKNDCRCPDGQVLTDSGKCKCPPGTVFSDRGRCVHRTSPTGGDRPRAHHRRAARHSRHARRHAARHGRRHSVRH